MRVNSRSRRRTVLFGTLLLVALIVLTGCPADGGGNGNGGNGGNGNGGNGNPPDTTPPTTPTGLTAIAGNEAVTISWDSVASATEYRVYRESVTEPIATITAPTITYTDIGLTNGTAYNYTVRAANGNSESGASDVLLATPGIDSDGDLLISISSLDQLDNIRHNLAGTAYQTSASGSGVQCGTATDTDCRGYELTRSLDFADGNSYNSGAVNDTWRPDNTDSNIARNSGWTPIGTSTTAFATLLEGNSNTISNLYTRGDDNLGLFGVITTGGIIANLGVIDGRAYGGDGNNLAGVLVGTQNGGTIIASYTSGGTVHGGGSGFPNNTGGFVGRQNGGSIIASYATGNVNGGDTGATFAGSLVGLQVSNGNGTIVASYATGNTISGFGNDSIGGLVGNQGSSNTVFASYATGNADGGVVGNDFVGRLTGTHNGTITVSYGFGTTGNGTVTDTPLPTNVNSANDLTLINTDDDSSDSIVPWNDAASLTLNAWDFGTPTQPPALRYADYDGEANGVYACASAENPPDGAILIANCGELLPGQGR